MKGEYENEANEIDRSRRTKMIKRKSLHYPPKMINNKTDTGSDFSSSNSKWNGMVTFPSYLHVMRDGK